MPIPQRAGTSLAVTVGGETVLLDCGPKAVYRLLENEIMPSEIERLYFTHQHMDHNASFFHFAITGWSLGRSSFMVYGPEGTEALLDALELVYGEDIDYRIDNSENRSPAGIKDIEFVEVTEEFRESNGEWEISALPVEHSIQTYAYRIEETATRESIVFSGDTSKILEFVEFARDVDILVQDCAIAPMRDTQPGSEFMRRYLDRYPLDDQHTQKLKNVHTSVTDAAEIAVEADVETLVLTHLSPLRDLEEIRRRAVEIFDGTVLVAEDGLTI